MSDIKAAAPAPGGQSTSGQIHDVLMGRIQRGELLQGVRLVDTAVAAEFGVSRMPARDALMRLAHEGYLEPTTRGFVLPRLDHDEILEIFDLRRLLEPRAAAMAAHGLSDEALAALGETLDEARAAMAEGDPERLFRACEIFRNGWIAAVSNASLRKALQRYMTQVQAVRMMTFADSIQADVQQADAIVLLPFLLDAFDAAEDPAADPALAAFAADGRIVEAVNRLADWDGGTPTGLEEGWDASDVDGVRAPPDAAEIDASVANTIYALWRGRLIANTIDATLDPLGLPRPGRERTLIAVRHLLDSYPVAQGVGASGLDFFQVPGVADADTERDILLLQSLAQALDTLAGDDFANAFGNSTDQDDYRWGRLHRIVLDSPLGGPFSQPSPPGNPPGFATDGGYQTVDPADHALRASDDGSFMYGAGASRRYVADFASRRISARSSLPGGPSGDIFSPFFGTLLDRWLTNDTYPLRQRPSDIFRGAVEFLTVRPPRRDDDDDDGDDDDDD